MPTRTHVLFAGGGTAGHLFPGLAVADRMVAQDPTLRVTFAIPGSEFECQWVHRHGYEYMKVPCAPRRFGPRGMWQFLKANWSGYLAGSKALNARRVSLVVGLGGYGSAPMGRAAIAQGVPLLLMEQNVIPGKATRWLARSAKLVCVSHEAARPHFAKDCPLVVTGNPVRAEVAALSRPMHSHAEPDRPGMYRLMVLGGSRGAQSLNQSVPFALYRLRDQLGPWHIFHQSGADDTEATRALYRKFALSARVEPFFADVAGVLRHTDLVVSRSGGTTLAELACAGVPAVCIPYPHAADGHQLANAQVYAREGACRVFDSAPYAGRFDAELASALSDVLGSPEIRREMSQRMRRLGRPDAAEQVASLAWSLLAGVPSRLVA